MNDRGFYMNLQQALSQLINEANTSVDILNSVDFNEFYQPALARALQVEKHNTDNPVAPAKIARHLQHALEDVELAFPHQWSKPLFEKLLVKIDRWEPTFTNDVELISVYKKSINALLTKKYIEQQQNHPDVYLFKEKKAWRHEFLMELEYCLTDQNRMAEAFNHRESINRHHVKYNKFTFNELSLALNAIDSHNTSIYTLHDRDRLGSALFGAGFAQEEINSLILSEALTLEAALISAQSSVLLVKTDPETNAPTSTEAFNAYLQLRDHEPLNTQTGILEDSRNFQTYLAILAKPYLEYHHARETLERRLSDLNQERSTLLTARYEYGQEILKKCSEIKTKYPDVSLYEITNLLKITHKAIDGPLENSENITNLEAMLINMDQLIEKDQIKKVNEKITHDCLEQQKAEKKMIIHDLMEQQKVSDTQDLINIIKTFTSTDTSNYAVNQLSYFNTLLDLTITMLTTPTEENRQTLNRQAELRGMNDLVQDLTNTNFVYQLGREKLQQTIQSLDKKSPYRALGQDILDLTHIKSPNRNVPSDILMTLAVTHRAIQNATANPLNIELLRKDQDSLVHYANSIRQDHKISQGKKIGGLLLVLSGVLLIAISVAAAVVSHGLTTPVSIAGVKLGLAFIIAGSAGTAATISGIGLFSKRKPTEIKIAEACEKINTTIRDNYSPRTSL